MAKLTEEQTRVRNANKARNLIIQADHNRASSNINSIGCIERYEDGMYRFCKWLGENTELKNLKNVSAKYIYPYVESFFDRECKTSTDNSIERLPSLSSLTIPLPSLDIV